jgi:hypothetical protein
MRFLETSEIEPLFRQHRPFVFGETFDFAVEQAYSEVEKAAIEALRARLGTPYRLNVAVYQGSELAGWSFGVQEGPARYYMINTGILPLLVHLSYFTNPLRRRMMDVRSGERIPDPELRKLLRLDGP